MGQRRIVGENRRKLSPHLNLRPVRCGMRIRVGFNAWSQQKNVGHLAVKSKMQIMHQKHWESAFREPGELSYVGDNPSPRKYSMSSLWTKYTGGACFCAPSLLFLPSYDTNAPISPIRALIFPSARCSKVDEGLKEGQVLALWG